ncbi:MAG: L-seryl-tRNA(Sec) selenium transferase [bacterium]
MTDAATTKTTALRELPSVDQLLRSDAATRLRQLVGAQRIVTLARTVTEAMRTEIRADKSGNGTQTRDEFLKHAIKRMETLCAEDVGSGLKRVINATGVILHTNLGRAPLSDAAREAVAHEAAGYCTLEYDSTEGTRGRRGARVENLLKELTGADDALVVNNCAAAALLIITVLAQGGETIVSRGELVEIGGDFRVPDVMTNSGTKMIEVGTTNRTHLDDYRSALNDQTRLILRVHPSNYRVVGFTAAPTLAQLASFAHEAGLPLYEDAGSGALADMSDHGLGDEPVIRDCVSAGADVVSFSGDKLLGSIQAGLIVGRREIISRLRTHSLYRALRVDKLTLAALETTLEAHRRNAAFAELPTLRMLAMTIQEIGQRASRLAEKLEEQFPNHGFNVSMIDGFSAVGGGSGPNTHPPTTLLAIEHPTLSADEIEKRLRSSSPPIITCIAEAKVLIDLRTVTPTEEPEILNALSRITS